MFKVLSWGCGLQSTTLAAMSALGEIDKLDVVIHADTGWERQVTVDIRDWYVKWLCEHDMKVEIVSAGSVRELGAEEHKHIPFWTDGGGPLRRQCTRHFKIDPIKRRIRELMGFDPRYPPHPKPGAVELWMGITVDEWTRAKPSRVKFIKHRWPLLQLKMSRFDCTDWLQCRGLPVPPKSACVCCPYRRASEWIEMREQSLEEWKAAVDFDEANRNNPLAERSFTEYTYRIDGEEIAQADLDELLELLEDGKVDPFEYEVKTGAGSTADELYVWRGGEPLSEVNFEFEAAKERQAHAWQLPMFACESGYCGI